MPLSTSAVISAFNAVVVSNMPFSSSSVLVSNDFMSNLHDESFLVFGKLLRNGVDMYHDGIAIPIFAVTGLIGL